MLIAGFPAGPWGTNCYVVATGPGAECVVVDPGKDAADGVAEVVREHRLKPVAVLVTHGHIDHMWCVAPVAGTYDATAWIHPERPAPAGRPDGRDVPPRRPRMLLGGDYEFAEPDDVEELADGAVPRAGRPRASWSTTRPGHTAGSVTFRTPYADQDEVSEVMFSGDLLFAGSIGRTDLPGGDHPTMLRSLRDEGAHPARRHRGAARPRRADLDRPGASHQPVPAGPRRGPLRQSCHARALTCPTSSTPRRASRSTSRPTPPRSARSTRPSRRPRSRPATATRSCAVFEDTEPVRARGGRVHRRGEQGDVHPHRPRWPVADAAPGGHGGRDPVRDRARPRPGPAPGQALVRRPVLPGRATRSTAATASSSSSASRRSAPTTRRWTPR